MRLAFQHFGGDHWLAGNTFIENMFLALRTLGPDRPTLILIVDTAAPEQDFQVLAAGADEICRIDLRPPPPPQPVPWSLRQHFAQWLRARLAPAPRRQRSHPLVAALRGHQVD